jgi:hypothetical protein
VPLISKLRLESRKTEVKVARVFEFVDMSGCVLHIINDPKNELPIPTSGQEITIGPSEMWVESVMTSSTNQNIYYVRVRTHATKKELLRHGRGE